MSTEASIEAFKSATNNGTIKGRNNRILAVLRAFGPLPSLEIKLHPFGSLTNAKERTDIDGSMSSLYFAGLVDRDGEKEVNGMMQTVWKVPDVPNKKSIGLQRELAHIAQAKINMDERERDRQIRLAEALARGD